ncbi:MAG: hypothetical protein WBB67_13655 [bacterium]
MEDANRQKAQDGSEKAEKSINREVQMSNIKCQLKSQYLMPNFEFCHLTFGLDLSFGFWNLSLDTQPFLTPLSAFSLSRRFDYVDAKVTKKH